METVRAGVGRMEWSVRLEDEVGLARNPDAIPDQVIRKESWVILVVRLIFDRLFQPRRSI